MSGADASVSAPLPEPLHDHAFHGLAGDIVYEIEPHSEASPVAILAQLLAAIGNAAGRGPGFKVEADRHHCNLFVAIVGDTAFARKGSSWGQAKRLVEAADPTWRQRIATGASSGEGLIWQVRDGIEEAGKVGKGEGEPRVLAAERVGVEDKRLMVIESELAAVLARMRRDGNTLSALLRQAWDGEKLDTLVKSSRATATDAHVSLIGHITIEELRGKLLATEQANGFANRFIWIHAQRSKELPFGGDPDSVEWGPYVERLTTAIQSGSDAESLDMDAQARQLWEQSYAQLTAESTGLLGAVIARGPAQVRRLAVIYALLDLAPVVTADHLRAALALWRYSCESAAFIFGGSLGNQVADRVLAELRKVSTEGLTRDELRRLYGRHRIAAQLDLALELLANRGLVLERTERTSGRSRTRYFCAESAESSDAPGLTAHTARWEES